MGSFLEKVTTHLLQQYTDIGQLVIITPGKRSALYIQKHLKTQLSKATFLPDFYNIQEFVMEISELKQIEGWYLILEFYDVYLKTSPSNPKDLLKFVTWAQILLADFNEIDKSMVDEKQVFSYLKGLKDIKNWSSTNQAEISGSNIWSKLDLYYKALKRHLFNKGLAYEGLIYRKANERVATYLSENKEKHFIFIGFNALSKVEEALFQCFLEEGRTKIYWDIDRYFMEDAEQEAGLFMRAYKSQWKYYQNRPFEWIGDDYSQPKNLSIVKVAGSVAQAYCVTKLLETATDTDTAVILEDEGLVQPLLLDLPREVNVTMGYPLAQSEWMSFFKDYITLYTEDTSSWHYTDIMRVISHPLYSSLFNDFKGLKKIIYRENRTRVSVDIINEIEKKYTNNPRIFFDPSKLTLEHLLDSCQEIIVKYQKKQNEKHTIRYEGATYFYNIFTRLKSLVKRYNHIKEVKILYHIFLNITSSGRISLEGDITEKQQIMGILESRSLDFDRLIITSLNEGIVPRGDYANSFLTYDLRLELGMSTQKERDAIYGYHFYRLLQRAREVYLLYDSKEDAIGGGGKSRFILQLESEYLPSHKLNYYSADAIHSKEASPPKSIKKDEAYLKRIVQMANKGFSPSSLTSYIYNPINFYTQYVLGLRDVDSVEESLLSSTFGTIAHDILEVLYKPFEDKYLKIQDVETMLKLLPKLLQEQFDKYATPLNFNKKAYASGKNYIIYNVILEYLSRFLKSEIKTLREGHTLKILKIEVFLKDIPLVSSQTPFMIHMKGKIDRIDIIDDTTLRIVDYKSGRAEPSNLAIKEDGMDNIIQDEKYIKAFQVLTYALMTHKAGLFDMTNSQAGIISFRNLDNGFMPFTYSLSGKKSSMITTNLLNEFQESIATLVCDIADMNTPLLEKITTIHGKSSLL